MNWFREPYKGSFFSRGEQILLWKNNIEELVEMLTVLSHFIPSIKSMKYSIMAEYCMANAKHYSIMKNKEQALYWSEMSTKYLLKLIELKSRKRA
jgi:hypothetical protein